MTSSLLPIYRRLVPAAVREPISRALRWPEGAHVSFAAHGEDLIVRSWLDELQVPRHTIRYLDIGANHPSVLSNTYLFYRMGGSGVLAEPTPDDADLLAAKRPRDILVRAGVAFDERREATLFRFRPSVFNTFSREEAKRWERELGDQATRIGEIQVPLMPVGDIISEHFASGPCHLLSIDVEGLDSAILAEIDWARFRPWFVCCERPDAVQSDRLLASGYSVCASLPHNTIFVLDDVTRGLRARP